MAVGEKGTVTFIQPVSSLTEIPKCWFIIPCLPAMSTRGVKVFDLYRKIPTDLTEATTVGGALSLFAA